MLAVITIIGILSVGMGPAINSLFRAQGVSKAAFDMAGVLDQARAYAMAKNTYVYVVDRKLLSGPPGRWPGV
jgi:type II secretory pathway pseudopilin PulG